MHFDQAWTQMNDTQTKAFMLEGGEFDKPGLMSFRIML